MLNLITNFYYCELNLEYIEQSIFIGDINILLTFTTLKIIVEFIAFFVVVVKQLINW